MDPAVIRTNFESLLEETGGCARVAILLFESSEINKCLIVIRFDAQHLLIHFHGELRLVGLLVDDAQREQAVSISLKLQCFFQKVDGLLRVLFAIVEENAHIKIAFKIQRIDFNGPLI